MTFQELKDIVNNADKYIPSFQKDKLIVRVVLDEPSVGHRATTAVKCIGQGIDWDSNSFLIWTEDKICRGSKVE